MLLVLTLDGGACIGLSNIDAAIAIESFRRTFIVPCIPVLMGTAVLYGLFTNWGFAKHSWLIAKWVLSIAVIVGFSALPYSAATVACALAATIALFAISIFKPGARKNRAGSARSSR